MIDRLQLDNHPVWQAVGQIGFVLEVVRYWKCRYPAAKYATVILISEDRDAGTAVATMTRMGEA